MKWYWSSKLALLELALLLTGAYFAGKTLWRLGRYSAFQSSAAWLLGMPAQPVEGPERLTIPRLGMSVLVVDGAGEDSLALGAGHVTGTARAGDLGNAVIAGHRDLAFRALRDVRIGDEVRVQNGATYRYIVDAMRIVDPTDVSVLAAGKNARLTLITCYPFSYVGTAPKRYVVQAEMLR